ncbi:tRNA(Ile)-lysidine synthetase [Pseudodesulfovibrio mercurii]|uniref:tRNA(Ile)-lysidine synthase n=1 Tax=Pseudodesulfovibrio mercurii TaxID=641491 RepID=F0JFD8_9BACT|nr:tRNA lysidine(34) synthetase TilS [Pseudodesulfovibrio mercurii]EGB13694.1 tRNA(Ile)-lysidine synthetase [Pseudodesulfovibrio mercurii]
MAALPADIPPTLQDLLPKWAHFCLYAGRFVEEELGIDLTGRRVLVGLSGGVDSTALLLVLHYLSSRADFTVGAVHLDHQLRPESADDATFARALCERLGIDCEVETRDVARLAEERGVGLEEAGREARYALYAELRESGGWDFIALGHQLDDLSEDVLMRLIRGTGWPGLSGMAGHDPARGLIRPLLLIPKSTLKAFVTHLGVPWREDASNADPAMTRNRVRNEILPLIEKENPAFWQSVARLWRLGRVEQAFWAVLESEACEILDNSRLESLHKAQRLHLYKACLDRLGPGQALADTLFKLDEAWRDRRVGAVFQFPGDKTASVGSGNMVFASKH